MARFRHGIAALARLSTLASGLAHRLQYDAPFTVLAS